MQRSSAKRRIGSHAPTAAIVLSQGSQPGKRSRAGLGLLVFMRSVAALWIAEGLLQWSVVVGGQNSIMTLTTPGWGTVVFFAVIDLIAAVGLWLATPWGGVIWLVSASAQILVTLFMPEFYDHPWLVGIADLVLISLYMVLTWQVTLVGERAVP